MAEVVDAKDLKSFGCYARAGSSPALGTSLRLSGPGGSVNFAWLAPVSRRMEDLRNIDCCRRKKI